VATSFVYFKITSSESEDLIACGCHCDQLKKC